MIDYIIGIGVAAAVVAIIVQQIRAPKNSKETGSCGCSCGSCPSSSSCHK